MVNLVTVKAAKISMICALTQLGSYRYEMDAECVNEIHISWSKWDCCRGTGDLFKSNVTGCQGSFWYLDKWSLHEKYLRHL